MNPCPATPGRHAALVIVAVACACVQAGLLAACTPAYNWREVRHDENGFQVMLPAKPATLSQPIELDGLRMTMTMTGARVDENLFTVGAVVLPDAHPVTRERVLAAMRAGMVRNLRGREVGETEIEVAVVDGSGRVVASETAARIEVDGTVAERPAHMTATFVSRGDRAWQAVTIARSHDTEVARLFHDSFRIAE